jgi:type IV secretory pathway TrbF-like protein
MENTERSNVLSADYVAGRLAYEEQTSPLRERITNLNRFLFTSLAGNLLLAGGLIYQGAHQQVKVMGFLLDSASHLVGLGAPVTGPEAFNEGVRIELLKEWITKTRTVLQSWETERALVEWALHHTSEQPHHAFSKLQGWYSENKPNERGKSGTVTVSIHDTLRLTGRTNAYQISWSETSYDPNGTKIGETRWTGIFDLALVAPKNLESAAENPAGFFITEFNWSPVN